MSESALRASSFRRVDGAHRGLIFVKGVPGVGFGDRVQIRDSNGVVRNGQVIRSADDVVLVQVFEGTDGIQPEQTWVRFLDEPFSVPVAPGLLGRIMDGAGRPRDGRPPIISAVKRNVNGEPVKDVAAFRELVTRLLEEKAPSLTFFAKRLTGTRFVEVRPNGEDEEETEAPK